MKKRNVILLFSLLLNLTGCNKLDNLEYTSFKEYVEIVKNATEEQQNVFVFTSSSCPHCQKIKPLLDKYISNIINPNLHIYELSTDYSYKNLSKQYAFKDSTMGYLTGNSENDCLKALDNRLSSYVVSNKIIPANDKEIFEGTGSNYSYVFTPLIIWYQGNSEVRFSNNAEAILQCNNKGNFTYESFEKFMAYPLDVKPWDKVFDLNYYEA